MTKKSPAPISELENYIGYKFKDKKLIISATTHSSSCSTYNYEILEFLGDRVLGLLVAKKLFDRQPVEQSLGKLAICYNKSVCTATLFKVATAIGLDKYIQLGKGESSLVEQIMADTCEALLAALFLDGGLSAAEKIFLRFWPLSEEFLGSIRKDPKSTLQEWGQKIKVGLPKYSSEELRSDPEPLFRVKVEVGDYPPVYGEGRSKQKAQQIAAEAFLNKYCKEQL